MVLDSTPSGLRNIIAITQGRPSRNRANPGLIEINPFRIEEWILQRMETQIILIPTDKTECDVTFTVER